jgi:hypothetical protein
MPVSNVNGSAPRGQAPIVDPAAEYQIQQKLVKQQQAFELKQQHDKLQKEREQAAQQEMVKAHQAAILAQKKKENDAFAAKAAANVANHAAAAAAAEEKRKQAADQKRQYEENQARIVEYNAQIEIARAAALERERNDIRRDQLRKDHSVLYRHYPEYLDFFPLPAGEDKDPYLKKLLANNPIPYKTAEDYVLAVKYAKEHWSLFLEYPRDMVYAAAWQRELDAKREVEKGKTI